MAVTAIDSQAGIVMFVTEGNLLRSWDIDIGGVRRSINQVNNSPKAKKSKEPTYQRNTGNAITAPVKNLSHAFEAFFPLRESFALCTPKFFRFLSAWRWWPAAFATPANGPENSHESMPSKLGQMPHTVLIRIDA